MLQFSQAQKLFYLGVFIVIIMLLFVDRRMINQAFRSSFFPYFFLPFYFSSLFLENALLSLLFGSKMSVTQYKYRNFSSLASLARIIANN